MIEHLIKTQEYKQSWKAVEGWLVHIGVAPPTKNYKCYTTCVYIYHDTSFNHWNYWIFKGKNLIESNSSTFFSTHLSNSEISEIKKRQEEKKKKK